MNTKQNILFFFILFSLNFLIVGVLAELPQVVIPLPTSNGGGTQTIIINGTAMGNCPDGYAVQNLTGTGLQCILMPTGNEPQWNGNSSTVARIGTALCGAGKVAQNITTTNSGITVECIDASAFGNSSWNQTGADSLYWTLNTSQHNIGQIDKTGNFSFVSSGTADFLQGVIDYLQSDNITVGTLKLLNNLTDYNDVVWGHPFTRSLYGNWSIDGTLICLANGTNCLSLGMNYTNLALTNQSNNFTNTNYFNNVNINTPFNSNFRLSVGGKSNFTDSISTFGSGGTCSGTGTICSVFNTQATCELNSNHNNHCAWNNNPSCGQAYPNCNAYGDISSCQAHSQLCSLSTTCTGNVGNCGSISQSYCGYVSGCYVGNTCSGYSYSCSDTSDPTACGNRGGCSWDYGGNYCSGSPSYQDCSYFPDYCNQWSGCSGGSSCLGTPNSYDCSGYSSPACENIPSCGLSFSSCNTVGNCESLSAGTCTSYNGCYLQDNYACAGTTLCDWTNSSGCNNERTCTWNVTNPNIKLFNDLNNLEMSISNDGSNLNFNSKTGLSYFTGNISATRFITRTSIYDKTKGSALSKVQDASYYQTASKSIDDSKFYGSTTMTVVDYSKSKDVEKCSEEKVCNEKLLGLIPQCTIKTTCKTYTTYPYTKEVQGVDLGMEIDVLRQSIYEMKTETCLKDKSYSWCVQ